MVLYLQSVGVNVSISTKPEIISTRECKISHHSFSLYASNRYIRYPCRSTCKLKSWATVMKSQDNYKKTNFPCSIFDGWACVELNIYSKDMMLETMM